MKLALVFPGQGSQSVGMGREIASWSAAARQALEEADDTLRFGLSRLCFEGPEEKLKLTENTQPAILAVSIASLRALQSQVEAAPAWVAGHSLGEYSALVAAGSISFRDALMAVRERGRAMQEAVPAGQGAMAALLGVDDADAQAICAQATGPDGLVSPANYNGPGQVVIAGHRVAVGRAIALFKERGGKRAMELPVSAPFHCALMEPAARRMEHLLKDTPIDRPKIVLINNADAAPVTEAAQVAPSLVRQVTSPVRWTESVRVMAMAGAGRFLEVGPGKVLTGLIRRIEAGARVASFGSPEDLDAAASLCREEG